MTQHTFSVTFDTTTIPVVVTERSKLEFAEEGLSAMDECLTDMARRTTPANAPTLGPTKLDMIERLLIDATLTGNTQKLVLCALWLAHKHPQIYGLEISERGEKNFVYNTENIVPLKRTGTDN